jgi:hypothetical protein
LPLSSTGIEIEKFPLAAIKNIIVEYIQKGPYLILKN